MPAMIYHTAINRYFLAFTPRLDQEKQKGWGFSSVLVHWLRVFLGFGVFVCGGFVFFGFNEYPITSTLCLHIPGQQLVVKLESNLEGLTFMLFGPQRNSLLISLNPLAHTFLQKNSY